MGPDAMILVFWMLSFKPTFSLSSFTFIKRLFSSSLLSAIRVVSSAYLRLLIFLQGILIPACASSSPAFLMMYSAYKLNKQGDNIQHWRTPFPIWNHFLMIWSLFSNLLFRNSLVLVFFFFWAYFAVRQCQVHYEEHNSQSVQYPSTGLLYVLYTFQSIVFRMTPSSIHGIYFIELK